MKVGDLVRVMSGRMGSHLHLGIITKQLGTHPLALDRFEVMTDDGNIGSYTTASLRLENETR